MLRPETPTTCPDCTVCGPCESGVHTCCRVRVPAGDMYHLCRCEAASCAARREDQL